MVGGNESCQAIITIAAEVTKAIYIAVENARVRKKLMDRFDDMKDSIFLLSDSYSEVLRRTEGQGK